MRVSHPRSFLFLYLFSLLLLSPLTALIFSAFFGSERIFHLLFYFVFSFYKLFLYHNLYPSAFRLTAATIQSCVRTLAQNEENHDEKSRRRRKSWNNKSNGILRAIIAENDPKGGTRKIGARTERQVKKKALRGKSITII